MKEKWSGNKNSAETKQSPSSSSRGIVTIYFWVLLQEIRPAPRWRMVTSSEHKSPGLSSYCLTTNQKKVVHCAALTSNFAFKNSSLKTISDFRSFEHEPPVLLAWLCNEPFSAPNYDILAQLASQYIMHTNLVLTKCCIKTVNASCRIGT